MDLAFTMANVIIFILNIALVYRLLTRKFSLPLEISFFTGVCLLNNTFLVPWINEWIQNKSISYFLMSNLYLIPVSMLFKEPWKVKTFIFYLILAVAQYIATILTFIDFYGRIYWGIDLPGASFRLILIWCEVGLLIFIYRYIAKTAKPLLAMISRESLIVSLLPLSACVMMTITRANQMLDFHSLLIITLVSGILLTVLYLLSLAIRLTNRKDHLENQLMIQLDHYKALTEGIQKNRIYRHDFRHHLAGIAELLKNQEIAATRDYLDTLNAEYTKVQIPMFCENKYADAIVVHYAKLAREASIQLSIELALPQESGIEPLDLCVIMGNCFENAIEACRAVPETVGRRIAIRAKIAHGYAAITFNNSCANEIKRQKGRFLSSKQPGRTGIGLESVRLLAEKYDGDIQVSTEGGMFTAAISLKIPTDYPVSGESLPEK